MNSDTENLTRRLAMADRALMALEAVMAQTREAIETARQVIADVQQATVRARAASGGAGKR
jgi:hypothetical protein